MIEKEKVKSELETVFQYLKLNDKSADFYLNCLVNGKTTINQISKNIKVARSTCYLILERLKTLGLVMETPFGKKRSLVAQSPEKLIELLKEEKEKSENAFNLAKEFLPKIKLYSTVDLNSKVRFYEGLESIKQIYNETLEAKEIFVFCLTQSISHEFEKFIAGYEKRLIEKGIETKEVVTDSEWDLEYIKKYSTKLNKIVSIPIKYSTDTDYMLWNNKVAFISFRNERLTGVVIEDQEITNFERMRFQLLWQSINH